MGFGQMAAGIGSAMVGEGAKQLARGDRPHLSDLLLTPGNAARVTDQLSRLRGAAMKLGQMISLDAGELLPPELTAILARLRDSAHFMPPAQLQNILTHNWGSGWRLRFAHFEARPMAAASIGQVHRARLHDGRLVAVKVQYPGIADSIDADVDNVATLLRLSGLMPEGLDVKPLLAAAKVQLKEEADYLREAEQMRRYATLLADDDRFVIPRPHDAWTSADILVMDFVEGVPIEALETGPQDQRDKAMEALLDLVMRELFVFGFMQTDPNFANYRWQPDSGRIVLLDFGAARPILPDTSQAYREMLAAGLAQDQKGLWCALIKIGFVSPGLRASHRPVLDAMLDTILTHVHKPGPFDFADRSFVEQIRNLAVPVATDRANWHLPPADTLFVQRKISGMALMAARLKARLPLMTMVRDFLNLPA
jgi:predicted unusual protein kinase regulating ubiquinone biosynthesis (AarF/ABC1/UbiB family)